MNEPCLMMFNVFYIIYSTNPTELEGTPMIERPHGVFWEKRLQN